MTDFKESPIICSKLDQEWAMTLPDIITEEISPVEISLLPDRSYSLNFTLEANILILSEQAAQEYKDENCPEQDEIELNFRLSSALLGKNY